MLLIPGWFSLVPTFSAKCKHSVWDTLKCPNECVRETIRREHHSATWIVKQTVRHHYSSPDGFKINVHFFKTRGFGGLTEYMRPRWPLHLCPERKQNLWTDDQSWSPRDLQLKSSLSRLLRGSSVDSQSPKLQLPQLFKVRPQSFTSILGFPISCIWYK